MLLRAGPRASPPPPPSRLRRWPRGTAARGRAGSSGRRRRGSPSPGEPRARGGRRPSAGAPGDQDDEDEGERSPNHGEWLPHPGGTGRIGRPPCRRRPGHGAWLGRIDAPFRPSPGAGRSRPEWSVTTRWPGPSHRSGAPPVRSPAADVRLQILARGTPRETGVASGRSSGGRSGAGPDPSPHRLGEAMTARARRSVSRSIRAPPRRRRTSREAGSRAGGEVDVVGLGEGLGVREGPSGERCLAPPSHRAGRGRPCPVLVVATSRCEAVTWASAATRQGHRPCCRSFLVGRGRKPG